MPKCVFCASTVIEVARPFVKSSGGAIAHKSCADRQVALLESLGALPRCPGPHEYVPQVPKGARA